MSLISKEEQQKVTAVRSLSLKSSWISAGDLRLDADYYAKDKDLALRILNDKRLNTKSLKALVKKQMYSGYRFRRIYTTDRSKGIPYLSATEALMFRPESERYLSKSKTDNLEQLLVKEGWILMTCSGVIGRLTIVNKKLAEFVLTHDLIRIIPDENEIPTGYLYAFLSTWIAQAIITKDQYGLAINHVEPHQIEDLPVPIIEEKIMNFIDEQIKHVFNLRQKANDNLDKAEDIFYQTTGLPNIIDDPLAQRKSFAVKSSMLDYRLDSSFHNPLLIETLRILKKAHLKLVKAGQLGKIIVAPRFKRIYVEKEFGVPFLQGSDLPMMIPYSLKYISKKMTANLQNWIIRPGWVFVTCSGTVGRVGMSTPITNGWAASQHILRIIPNGIPAAGTGYAIDSGYITLYLSTPYGYNQVIAKTYGGVVDEINEHDIGEVLIAIPQDKSAHDKIAELTREAYALKDLAALIEKEVIKLLEGILDGSLKSTNVDTLKQSLSETIGLQANIETVADVYEAINEINEGHTISFEDLKTKYGL